MKNKIKYIVNVPRHQKKVTQCDTSTKFYSQMT